MDLKDWIYSIITIISLVWAISSFFISVRKTRENESLKLALDKKQHIAKSLFEYEFESCKRLMGLLELMVDTNGQLFPHFSKPYLNPEKEKERLFSIYSNSLEARKNFLIALGESRPFIDEALFKEFSNIQEKCIHQIFDFEIYKLDEVSDENIKDDRSGYRDCFKKQDELFEAYEKLSLHVRDYFLKMVK